MTHELPTLLLVDDTPNNLELLISMLEPDYELLVAAHGQEALDIATTERPDLILMDVMMPIMDGFEACRRLKTQDSTRNIPVLFLTAVVDTEGVLKGFAAGGIDYVTKPFHPEELKARVATHVALKLAQDRERALRRELENALARVKQLSGLLPICASCKMIRDEKGEWSQMEAYITSHSEADFTHGLCPNCARDFMRELKDIMPG